MGLSINTNMASLTAQRNLMSTQGAMDQAMQRLSSGLRINSAKDDASGLYTSELMTADIRGLNQAARNAQDGISLAQTAEAALGQISNNLQRIREIAVQASNETTESFDGLQAEVDQLTQEISRIVATTKFNGKAVLGGDVTAGIKFQVGQDSSDQITVEDTDGDMDSLNASDTSDLTATGTLDVSSAAAASAEIAKLDTDIEDVAKTRAKWGAVQNRFEAVVQTATGQAENLSAARGRIIDADFAAETANFTRGQILQQAGVSMLAQANMRPQAVLALLQ